MTDAQAFRLDLGDIAEEAGWKFESFRRIDEFSKDGVTVMVQFAADDEIESLTRSREGRADEVYGGESVGKADRLLGWLGVRARTVPTTLPSGLPNIPYDQDSRYECWAPETFYAAVEDPGDRVFMLRMLDLIAVNSQLPQQGNRRPLWFGAKRGGSMFVHPCGRSFAPFKLSIRQGRLLIAGCWTVYAKAKNDPGFADLAGMLQLSEQGPASFVPVFGLDPDEVWEVWERVSQAIN